MKQLAKLTQRPLNSLFKYIGAALLIFIPLYPKFPVLFLPSSTVALRAEDLLILVAVLMLILAYKNKWVKSPPVTYQILVYWAVGLLSAISAILITKNVDPLLSLLHFARRIEYMSLFFIFY